MHSGIASSGCEIPIGGPRTLATNPTTIITVMLRQIDRTTRPSVLDGRVLRFAKSDAPGSRSIVRTPGRGAIGECVSASAMDSTNAVVSQSAVGLTTFQ